MSYPYPDWWDSTITVFNKFTDPQTQVVKWYKTILSDCYWQYVDKFISSGNSMLETESTICRIPQNEKFLERFDWVALPNDKMSEYFTFGVDDIIIKGEIDDEIDEYTRGKHSTDILAKYKGLRDYIILHSVSLNIGVGRVCPHYCVRG